MITQIKYFKELTNDDYKNYSKIWDENRERMIFFQQNIQYKYQIKYISEQLKENNNKDILAIRWPSDYILKNKIIKNILNCTFLYDINKTWVPSEIWIYH
jgi:hypothetical protein